MFNLKAFAIIAAAAFASGAFSGSAVVWKMWNASNDAKQVASLTLKLKARDAAAKEDTERAVANALETERNNKEQDEVISTSTDRPVLVGPGADRLRDLWNN